MFSLNRDELEAEALSLKTRRVQVNDSRQSESMLLRRNKRRQEAAELLQSMKPQIDYALAELLAAPTNLFHLSCIFQWRPEDVYVTAVSFDILVEQLKGANFHVHAYKQRPDVMRIDVFSSFEGKTVEEQRVYNEYEYGIRDGFDYGRYALAVSWSEGNGKYMARFSGWPGVLPMHWQ